MTIHISPLRAGQVNEKNVAYCQKRCQDDCAAGDGFGATETFIDADMPRVSKDSEKSPVERFAAWQAAKSTASKLVSPDSDVTRVHKCELRRSGARKPTFK